MHAARRPPALVPGSAVPSGRLLGPRRGHTGQAGRWDLAGAGRLQELQKQQLLVLPGVWSALAGTPFLNPNGVPGLEAPATDQVHLIWGGKRAPLQP